MTMSLFDDNNELGQLCTNAGWGELHELKNLKKYKYLRQFLQQGYTERADRVATDVSNAMKDVVPRTVSSTLRNFSELLGKRTSDRIGVG